MWYSNEFRLSNVTLLDDYGREEYSKSYGTELKLKLAQDSLKLTYH